MVRVVQLSVTELYIVKHAQNSMLLNLRYVYRAEKVCVLYYCSSG